MATDEGTVREEQLFLTAVVDVNRHEAVYQLVHQPLPEDEPLDRQWHHVRVHGVEADLRLVAVLLDVRRVSALVVLDVRRHDRGRRDGLGDVMRDRDALTRASLLEPERRLERGRDHVPACAGFRREPRDQSRDVFIRKRGLDPGLPRHGDPALLEDGGVVAGGLGEALEQCLQVFRVPVDGGAQVKAGNVTHVGLFSPLHACSV